MNGYLLMGKVLVSNVLKSTQKNPFAFSSSGKYRFINWKRIFVQQTNEVTLVRFSPNLKNKQPRLFITCSRTRRKNDKNSNN